MPKDTLGKSASFTGSHIRQNDLQAGRSSNNLGRTRSAPNAAGGDWKTRQLPLYSYRDVTYAVEGADKITRTPRRVYIVTENEANTWVPRLKGPIGFDLEWPFDRTTNINGRTAMVQLSDDHTILLLHIAKMEAFPNTLKELIESQDIIKTGFWIANDCAMLMRDFNINPQGCIELVNLAKHVDLGNLQRHGTCLDSIRHELTLDLMARLYLEKRLAKDDGVRVSNWSQTMSEEQLEYAANDAHCGLTILKKLRSIAEGKGVPINERSLAGQTAKDALYRKSVYERGAVGSSSGARIRSNPPQL